MRTDLKIIIKSSRHLQIAVTSMLFLCLLTQVYLVITWGIYSIVALFAFLVLVALSWPGLKRIFAGDRYVELLIRRDFSLQITEFLEGGAFISTQEVCLEQNSRAWSNFVSLHLRCATGDTLYLCVLPDCMQSQDFRRLKVVVRFARQSLNSNILALNQL